LERAKINRNRVIELATQYDAMFSGKNDQKTEKQIVEWFEGHSYLDRANLIKLGMWKSPRPKRFYEDISNSESKVRSITELAIASADENTKISVLQTLKGVSWPVASVILHFAQPDKYMIMDFRAIWSLGMEQPKSYNFNFWMKYTQKVRSLSEKTGENLRTLDKALWMYSKLNQT